MKAKTPIAVLLIMLVCLSLLPSVSVQAQAQAKGSGDASALDQKAPKGKPSPGIATGVVAPQVTEQKYAIIIGISDYAGTKNDLQYCDDDAYAFDSALLAAGWDSKNIILLIDSAANHDAIIQAIRTTKGDEGANDQVVFFYSGHGSTGVASDGDSERKDECIIPYECTVDTFIWDGDLKTEFAGFESQRIMFYFDSCFAGGMTDLAGTGRLVLMACGENQMSLESSTWQNGQFTYYFVDQGMVGHLADKDGKNGVTFEEAFDYAKAMCKSQTPVASDGFTSDMPY